MLYKDLKPTLLLDEKLGRRLAIQSGLQVTGLLGVLAEAKKRGIIPACAPVLDEMIRVAGLWIGAEPRAQYLRGIGEGD